MTASAPSSRLGQCAGLEYIHSLDQIIRKPVAVSDRGVQEELTRARIVDHLVDLDGHAAVRLLGEGLRLDGADDLRELPMPVVGDCRPTHHATTLPCVRPVNIGMHQLESRVEVVGVEGSVGRQQVLFPLRHRFQPTQQRRLASRLGSGDGPHPRPTISGRRSLDVQSPDRPHLEPRPGSRDLSSQYLRITVVRPAQASATVRTVSCGL